MTATPALQQPAPMPLFAVHRVSSPGRPALLSGELGKGGLGIILPLPYGATLEGIERTYGQKTFLQTMAAGNRLIAYDQRGAGGSAAGRTHLKWNDLGADLWTVADRYGIERAVLYGVFDGGYTVAYAAAQRSDRMLGIILNFVPPVAAAPVGERGVPEAVLQRWFAEDSPVKPQTFALLQDLGIYEEDAEALAASWAETVTPDMARERAALLRSADLRSLLPSITAPALVIEPRARELFRGWGEASASLLPNARAVRPARASQALGAIHGFLAVRRSVVGRDASRLSPALSRLVEEGERSVSALGRIVIAVDDSLASARAVELACRMGELQRAEIILVCVIEVPRALPLEKPDPAAVKRGQEALQLSGAIVSEHGLTFRTLLRPHRDIAGGIVGVADEEKADLIVMPNLGGEESVSGMGRIARDVVRRAHCEVFVDRQDLDGAGRAASAERVR